MVRQHAQEIELTSQMIGAAEIGWFNPGVKAPPFETKLMLMVAGSRSDDCCKTFEVYTEVVTARVQEAGPGDDYDDVTAHAEFIAGEGTEFLEYQFYLKNEAGDELDWYSDSIVAWAYYPLGIAQAAVDVERERQARAIGA